MSDLTPRPSSNNKTIVEFDRIIPPQIVDSTKSKLVKKGKNAHACSELSEKLYSDQFLELILYSKDHCRKRRIKYFFGNSSKCNNCTQRNQPCIITKNQNIPKPLPKYEQVNSTQNFPIFPIPLQFFDHSMSTYSGQNNTFNNWQFTIQKVRFQDKLNFILHNLLELKTMAEDLGMNSSAITQAHYQLKSTKNSSILPPISPSSSIDLDLNFDDVFDFEKGNLLGEDEIINVTQINELNYFQL